MRRPRLPRETAVLPAFMLVVGTASLGATYMIVGVMVLFITILWVA